MRFARDTILSWPGTSVPERFVVTPPDLRPASPARARDFYNGQFTFVGQTVQVGSEAPFATAPPSVAWAEALHGFRWLRHLAAAPGSLAGAQARALVADWLSASGSGDASKSTKLDLSVTAARLIAFLQHGRFLLTGADHAFYRSYMRAIAQHVSVLKRCKRADLGPTAATRVDAALTLAVTCLPVNDAVAARTVERLADTLAKTILPDGGFVTRNSDDLADCVADLLSLAKSYAALDKPVPTPVVRALDRMLPRLRAMMHADGELVTFHGASGGNAQLVGALLDHDETSATATRHAVQSGYITLLSGPSKLIADIGTPATDNGATSYQSLSAFEFSSDGERLFINVGSPPSRRADLLDVAIGAAAHSRMTLDDEGTLASDLRRDGWMDWPALDAGEDGFLLEYTLGLGLSDVHCIRGVRLSADGRTLDGFDRVQSDHLADGILATTRFHLSVKTNALKSGERAVVVDTPRGQRWRGTIDGGQMRVDPSIQLAHPAGLQRTKCIAVTFDPGKTSTVAWRWSRER